MQNLERGECATTGPIPGDLIETPPPAPLVPEDVLRSALQHLEHAREAVERARQLYIANDTFEGRLNYALDGIGSAQGYVQSVLNKIE